MTAPTQDENPLSLAMRRIPLILLGLAAIFLALWLTVLKPADSTPAGRAPNAPPTQKDPLAEIPPELRAPLDAPDASVKVLVDVHGEDLARLAAAIGELEARPIPGDAPGAPRKVGTLAAALAEKKLGPRTQVASFERAMLFGAAGRALDKTPSYAWVRGSALAASELVARVFAVRFADDEPWWVFPALPGRAGQATGPTRAEPAAADFVALGERDVAAIGLAFWAMGAASARDHDAASRLLGFARQLRPEDPAILFLIGRVEYGSGLGPVAQRTLDRAVGLARDAMTDFLLGRLARLDGRPVDAVAAFVRATEADPTFGEPHVELAELALERLDLTPKAQHAALLEEARGHVAAARKANPETQGMRLVEAHLAAFGRGADGGPDPDDSPEAATRRHEAAVKLLTEETELHPHLEAGWMLLAQVLTVAEQDADAIAALERCRAAGWETGELANARGQLLAASGRFDEALAAFETALDLDPNIAELRPQAAQIRRQKGDMARARKLMQEQLEMFPDDRVSKLLLAQLEIDDNQPAAARAILDGLLKADPEDVEARIIRYVAALVEGADAKPFRAAAVEAAGGLRKLAEILLQQGMREPAEPLLVEALEAEADDLIVPVLLVALQSSSGRLEEAALLRQKTVESVDEADRAEIDALFDEAIREAMKAVSDDGAGEGTP
jgi:tetratricopeptide (TPR) repeat protein